MKGVLQHVFSVLIGVSIPGHLRSEFDVVAFVSKPSSQGRLDGATGMYLCVFETKAAIANGFKCVEYQSGTTNGK
jgi:hypothetical protein